MVIMIPKMANRNSRHPDTITSILATTTISVPSTALTKSTCVTCRYMNTATTATANSYNCNKHIPIFTAKSCNAHLPLDNHEAAVALSLQLFITIILILCCKSSNKHATMSTHRYFNMLQRKIQLLH